MGGRVPYGIQNMFSIASRDLYMSKVKKVKMPKFGSHPLGNAAVLLPLCRVDDVPCILYTVRSPDQRMCSGQISFPGGESLRHESAVQTALRETEEEIGLSRRKIEVWGPMPQVHGRNNKLLITPIIGCIDNLTPEDLHINLQIVSKCFAVPVEMLCDSKNQFHTQYKDGFVLPVFKVERYKIWGITAFLTHAFLSSILNKHVYKNEWMDKKIIVDK